VDRGTENKQKLQALLSRECLVERRKEEGKKGRMGREKTTVL
jgi:hypothetical protein